MLVSKQRLDSHCWWNVTWHRQPGKTFIAFLAAVPHAPEFILLIAYPYIDELLSHKTYTQMFIWFNHINAN